MKRATILVTILPLLASFIAIPISATSYPILEVKPESIDFNEVDVGSESLPQVVTVASSVHSTFTLMIFEVYLEGPDKGEFTIIEDNCTGRMMEGSMSATIVVAFTPHSPGPKQANLVIESNASETDIVVPFPIPMQGNASGATTSPPGEDTPVDATTNPFPWWILGVVVALAAAGLFTWRRLASHRER